MKLLKNTFKLVVSTFIILFSLVACESISIKDDIDKGTSIGSMSAVIDGVAWQATQAEANLTSGILGIAGLDATGKTIVLSLTETQAGVYQLDQSSFNAAAYKESSNAFAHTSNATANVGGTVEVTEINLDEKWISGTFSFTAFRFTDNTTVNITAGVFTKIPLSSGFGAGNGSSMSLKLDGTAWEATSVIAVSETTIGTISISGINGDKTIGLTLPIDITVGDHELLSFTWPTALYNIGTGINVTPLAVDEGSVTITKHDVQNKTIEGTFHFEASEFGGSQTASITEGMFSASY